MGLQLGGGNVPKNALRRRVRYSPPWHLVRWGLLWNTMFGRVLWPHRGCDEYHNQSWFIIIPLIGEFVYFTKSGFQRDVEHLYYLGPGGTEGFIDPDCSVCTEILEDWT